MTKSANLYSVNKVFCVSDKMRLSNLTPNVLAIGSGPTAHCTVGAGPGCEALRQEAGEGDQGQGATAVSLATKTAPLSADMFFQLESLGCPVMPKCGGCRCGKCPVPGSQYSFKEQQQLDQIRRQLHYDGEKKKWTAELRGLNRGLAYLTTTSLR